MRKRILLSIMLLSGGFAFAQKENVGIGTTNPDQSAVLDISSPNKGLLMPRMSSQQRNSIQNPAKGLIVYQTDMLSGFYFYDGKEWKGMGMESSVVGTDGDWTLGGNAATATDFLGTTNDVPLKFKVGNSTAGYISSNTNKNLVAIGRFAAETNIATNGDALGGGISNVAIGYEALRNNTTGGNYNMAIGERALKFNTTGVANTAIGARASEKNTSGTANMAFGYLSLFENTTGNYNTAIGQQSLVSLVNGNNNTAIGTDAGFSTLGSGNTFIGYQAGYNEVGGNKLYIANSNTATPLVYGDFTAKYLAVGEVSAADRAANTSGGYRLLVKGGMITEKIKVATAGTTDWADYVFDDNYKRMTLEEVESFINENKHLPNVPTTEQMITNGNDLQKTDAKLLEKIEELTLYIIEINKEIKALKAENSKLKK